jgi:hypothetical protein
MPRKMAAHKPEPVTFKAVDTNHQEQQQLQQQEDKSHLC